jgi:hypothetical protein
MEELAIVFNVQNAQPNAGVDRDILSRFEIYRLQQLFFNSRVCWQ